MATVVEIVLADDGKLYVGLDEGGEAAPDTSQMQPAGSAQEAAKMALHILSTSGGAGQSAPTGDQSAAGADQAQGAGGVTQAPQDAGASQSSPNDAQSMWDEMAQQKTPMH